jgi:CHAT domain-containing protein/tetratricopeptide (TPR) repeat protein
MAEVAGAGLLSGLLACLTWPELQAFAAAHASEFDDVKDRLALICDHVRQQGDAAAVADVEQRQAVLSGGWSPDRPAAGRVDLIDLAAYRPIALVYDMLGTASWEDALRLALEQPGVTDDALDAALVSVEKRAQQAGDDDTAGAAQRHRIAVSRARRVGVAATAGEVMARPQLRERKDMPAWLKVIARLIAAEDDEIEQILGEYPALLSDDGDALLRNMFWMAIGQHQYSVALFVEERRMMLNRARRPDTGPVILSRTAANEPIGVEELMQEAKNALKRYDESSDRRVLDNAVSRLLAAFRSASRDEDPEQWDLSRLLLLNYLGSAFIRKFRAVGTLGYLQLAVDLHRTVLDSAPEQTPSDARATFMDSAIDALSLWANTTGDRSPVAMIVALSEQLVQLLEEPTPRRAHAMAGLAGALLAAYDDDGDLDRVDRVLALCREVLSLPVVPARTRLTAQVQLVMALLHRYQRTGHDDGFDSAIEDVRTAILAAPGDDGSVVGHASSLGTVLTSGFIAMQRLSLADAAIDLLDLVVDRSYPAVPAGVLCDLSTALRCRYEAAGDELDLDRALDVASQAVRIANRQGSHASAALVGLAGALSDRYRRHGEATDLDEAVAALEQAEGSATGEQRLLVLANLGFMLVDRYQAVRDPADLDRSITVLEEVVTHTLSTDPDRLGRVQGLAGALRLRAMRLARQSGAGQADARDARADLDQAVILLEEAISNGPDRHPRIPGARSALGLALWNRFSYDHDVRDIERAGQLIRSAIESIPGSSPQHDELLWNYLLVARTKISHERAAEGIDAEYLGSLMPDTYRRLLRQIRDGGDRKAILDDLDAEWEQLVRTEPNSSGEAVQASADQEELLDDLPASLQLLSQPEAQLRIDMPQALWPLVIRLNEIMRRSGGPDADSVRAVAAIWQAVLSHPALAEVNEQGQQCILLKGMAAFLTAYNLEGSLPSLDRLIGTYQRLLAILPEEHPWHPVVLIDTARMQGTRHSLTADVHDLDTAFETLTGLVLRVAAGEQHWLTCLSYLASLLEKYPDTARRTGAYAQRVQLVDRLLMMTSPDAEGIRFNQIRMALVGGYLAVSSGPAQQLDAIRRATELAAQAHAVEVRNGRADVGWDQLAKQLSRRVADLTGAAPERFEVTLEELLDQGDRSDPAAAVERINKLRLAARQIPIQGDPTQWLVVHAALASELRRTVSGSRSDNLEEAIAVAHEMVPVAERQGDSEHTALAYLTLGELYLDRVRGSHPDNIDRALEYSHQAVQLAEPGSATWAIAQIHVTILLTKRTHGDQRADMEEALERCRQAIPAIDPAADPRHWAVAQSTLGRVYADRVAGGRADNIEHAIAAHNAALEVLTFDAAPHEWADVHHDLAITYANRPRGDREENLRQAIQHYEQELRYFTREQWPFDWAMANLGLGSAYSQARRPSPQHTMQAAVAAFEAALTVLTQADYPIERADALNSLGLVLIDADGIGGRPLNPQRALECFRAALESYDPQTSQYERARVLLNMVGPLSMLAHQHRDNQVEAIKHSDAAMAYASEAAGTFDRDVHPLDWARAQTGLAQCAWQYARLGQEQYLPTTAKALENALEVFREGGLLIETRSIARNLANTYAAQEEWSRAAAAYKIGADAAEELYQASILSESRGRALQSARPLVEIGVTALAKLHDLDGAVVAVERARARWLGEALARDRADLDRLAQELPELAAAYYDASMRLQSAEVRERKAGTIETVNISAEMGTSWLAEQVASARTALNNAITRIRRRVGYERFLALPDINDIGTAVRPSEPLAYLVPTDNGCLRLLVHRSESSELAVEAHWSEALTKAHINQLILGNDNAGRSYLSEQIAGGQKFGPMLAKVLNELGRHVVGPLANRLKELGATGVVLIPGGRLALLPLHAAAYDRGGQPTRLLDEFDVCYSPSAWVDADTRAAAARYSGEPGILTGIADPAGDLKYAHAELEDVAALFSQVPPRVHYGSHATKAALLADLPGATYVHLACHGCHDLTDPLESHLQLADDERLTLRELMDGRSFHDIRLVVASACETALAEFTRLPDEVLGLPAGFLRAGAAAVIGTLWRVDDLATALLMIRFYELHLGTRTTGSKRSPVPAARALRLAQQWLARVTAGELAEYFAAHDSLRPHQTDTAAIRLPAELAAAGAILFGFDRADNCPFQDPVYWAPFLLMGG